MINIIKFSLIAFCIMILSGCSETKDENIWIVGTSPDNPPYEYMKQGKIQGFDIDLIREIAKYSGKKIEFKNMDFHGLLAALSSRNIDMVIAGMSVTEDRKKKVDFSIPYSGGNIAFLVKKSQNITKIEQLTDKKVGSQLGTIWSSIADELSMKYKFKNKTLANNLMLVEEMKVGRLNAVLLEESQVNKFSSKNDAFTGFVADGYSSFFSIAMPKNSNFKLDIDEAITALKNDGTINSLEKKWGIISEYQ